MLETLIAHMVKPMKEVPVHDSRSSLEPHENASTLTKGSQGRRAYVYSNKIE